MNRSSLLIRRRRSIFRAGDNAMRLLPTFIAVVCLAGCASKDYSRVPEPTGEWVPANPPRLAGEVPPSPRPTRLSVTGQGDWR